jgi:hypothetical protein
MIDKVKIFSKKAFYQWRIISDFHINSNYFYEY